METSKYHNDNQTWNTSYIALDPCIAQQQISMSHLLRERVSSILSNETKYQLRFRKCTLCARVLYCTRIYQVCSISYLLSWYLNVFLISTSFNSLITKFIINYNINRSIIESKLKIGIFFFFLDYLIFRWNYFFNSNFLLSQNSGFYGDKYREFCKTVDVSTNYKFNLSNISFTNVFNQLKNLGIIIRNYN